MSNIKYQMSRVRSAMQNFCGQTNLKRGFSLVELIVVMSIIITLLGLITINLASTQQKFSLNTVVQSLISDIRQQQIKAMVGDAQGAATSDSHGIHTDSNKYVLFKGSTYSATDPSNFEVSLPTNVQFVSWGSDTIFSKISGEITAVTSLELQDTTNSNTKTIQINKYGVVTGVN